MLRRRDKTATSVHATFNNSEDFIKNYEIKDILSLKVELEQLTSSKLIPQCKNCQF